MKRNIVEVCTCFLFLWLNGCWFLLNDSLFRSFCEAYLVTFFRLLICSWVQRSLWNIPVRLALNWLKMRTILGGACCDVCLIEKPLSKAETGNPPPPSHKQCLIWCSLLKGKGRRDPALMKHSMKKETLPPPKRSGFSRERNQRNTTPSKSPLENTL